LYDMRNYRQNNDYGPFLRGSAKNWVHTESIVNVIPMNLMELHGVWVDTLPPVGLEAITAYSVAGAADHAMEDWACIEGIWRRYISFMNY
jgi:hypothetical protein